MQEFFVLFRLVLFLCLLILLFFPNRGKKGIPTPNTLVTGGYSRRTWAVDGSKI